MKLIKLKKLVNFVSCIYLSLLKKIIKFLIKEKKYVDYTKFGGNKS